MVDFTGGTWRSLIDGSEVSAIPDSLVLQYAATNVSGGDTTWSDDNEVADMTLTGGETDTTVDDVEALGFDGTDDHGNIDLPSDFEGDGLNEFTVEFSISTTTSDNGRVFEQRNNDENQDLGFIMNSGPTGTGGFLWVFDDDNGDRFRFGPDSDPNLNDGERHDISIIIEDAVNHEATVIIDESEIGIDVTDSDSPNSFTTWDNEMGIAARNDGGSMNNHLEVDVLAMRWYSEAIEDQTINKYPL